MKSIHQFQVKASIETIYNNVLSAERWLSFVPGYQGLESADSNWPNEGASITVRYTGLKRIKTTVVEHEHRRRFRTHEEALSGRFIDNVELAFQEKDGATVLTLVNDTTIRPILLMTLLLPLRRMIMELVLFPHVKKRIKAMVETRL